MNPLARNLIWALVFILTGCQPWKKTEAFAQGSEAPAPVSLRWSDPAAWPSGRVPLAGENVTVPANIDLTLDVSPPPLGGLTVLGTLRFAEQPLELSAAWIMLHGRLEIGRADRPFPHRATITLTASQPQESVMGMGTRGIMVMGGTLELHGQAKRPVRTYLAAHAAAGSTTLTLHDAVNWKRGDEIVLAPTDFYDRGGTEAHVLHSRTGQTLTLRQPLQKARWGALQYIDAQGVTLTPSTAVTPKVIDQRAEVGNLTRNIVIQGLDDTLWNTEGFGAQVMFMNGGVAHVDGVQFRRMGQAGRIGRYPLHWHLLSYEASGREIGDVTGQYVRNSVVTQSSQRCMVIHGTNGLTLTSNICHDIRGHAFFLEDAVERRNVLQGNLVLKVRAPLPGRALQHHETLSGERIGPSGFWLTNPDNIIRGNAVADVEGIGFWLAYPRRPLGLNKSVPIEPQHTPFGVFDDNVTHSNQILGFQIDQVPMNDAGDTEVLHYIPLQGGLEVEGALKAPFSLSRLHSYKNPSALWNRVHKGTFTDFVVSDYQGVGFKGGSQQCLITRSIIAGRTLNNPLPLTDESATVGAASYHSECDITGNIFVNLPAVPGRASGAFDTSDYYTNGLDLGLRRNVDNVFVNTHPGYRTPSMNTLPVNSGRENWSLAGALWDPHGLWGTAGHYWVYDSPFFTGGTSCSDVRAPVHGNDKSCAGPYYGFGRIAMDQDPGPFIKPILYHRQDTNTDFFVDDGACTWRLGWMRNTAFVKNGTYKVTFPAGRRSDDQGTCQPSQLAADTPPPRRLVFTITNLKHADDGFLLAIEYDGSVVPTVYRTSWPNPEEMVERQWESWIASKALETNWKSKFRGEFFEPMTRLSSLAEVQHSNGQGYWQDSERNLVWMMVRRTGLQFLNAEPNSDLDLEQPVHFVLNNAY